MSTLEATKTSATEIVANRLVQLCREGKNVEAIGELYSDDIISIEPKGSRHERTEGKAAVLAKTTQWQQMVEQIHNNHISDPIFTGNHFACVMEVDVTLKEMGRIPMNEVCVFEVRNGKIVHEQFFYDLSH
jgi:hypothetical protein